MNSKLIRELQTLIENDVISTEAADKIEAYYNSIRPPQQNNRLLTVFGIFGSLLVGLGIILVLAHNWDDFSRSIKTILAFLPLIIGQVIVGYSLLKKKSSTWLESSGVFLFLAVGCSISLVSQIYNIPGNFSSFLLTWILLCLPLIYLLKSKSLFLLILIYATVYGCDLGYNFSGTREIPWMYLITITLLLPNYIQLLKNEKPKNITALLNWFIPLSLIINFGAFINASYQLVFLMYIFLFGLLYTIGSLNVFKKLRLSKNGFIIIGSIGIVITMLSASFESFWDGNLKIYRLGLTEIVISILLVFSSLTLSFKMKAFNKKDLLNNVFQFISLIMIAVFLIHFIDYSIAVGVLNLFILALGVSMIKRGMNALNFTFLNYGLLILTALIITRFFDSNITFVVRGILFIIVGVCFFASNYLMLKKIKKNN